MSERKIILSKFKKQENKEEDTKKRNKITKTLPICGSSEVYSFIPERRNIGESEMTKIMKAILNERKHERRN